MNTKSVLSALDKKCLMKYFMTDLPIFNENSNEYVRSLGVEGSFETLEEIAETEPEFIKIVAHDINNFVILFDENSRGNHTPIFVMRDGVEQELFEEDSEGEEWQKT